MNPSGTAYLAYRVPTEAGSNQNIIPGYLDMDTRVARYNGSLWSVLGSPADRNQSLPVRAPTAENSPKVGVSVDGNGLVAFQEPDEEFVDRVWARRVFNTTYGIPLLVSPKEYGGLPLRGPADAFDLAVSGFGEGAISFRQQPAQGSALSSPRVFTSTIPEAFSDNAGQFTAARTVDSGGATPGAPSVGVTPDGVFRTVWSDGAAARIANGSDTSVDPPAPVGDGKGAVGSTPLVDVARNEASVIAWRARSGVVAADEIRQNGSFTVKGVSNPSSGVISDLRLSGSGIGDGLVGFRQGDQGQTRVEAAIVDSPPLDFAVQVPLRFIHSKRPLITWDPAENALSRVRYTVTVRGKVLGRNISGTALRLNGKKLRDGRSKVEVIATDGAGQRHSGTAATLRLDRSAPRLRVSRHGRMVKVRVYDRVAGLRRSSVKVSFGDGKRARGKARVRHRYRRGGYVRLTVKATDKAGNRVTLERRVRL